MCNMNRHFHDVRYYLRRAGEATAAGFGEELEPVRARLDSIRGREAEPEPGRFDRMRLAVRDARLRTGQRLEGLRARRPTR